ncbi:SMI1/KNR4 family protein [Actinoplanes aureus]|uniref:SMI1/KNR4 family protein n=1 Tax=Actinoplanes aureus TaxID=2792083 RepID=A0A931CIK7_9ACTN|nr:SMI1/KNR4 family protein [Actinoplanes aureus]MBG0569254.1 SMI1/KNR4 family protein [Actinoplanes aureus]
MNDHEARRDVLRLLPEAERPPGEPFPGGADDQEIADLERRLGIPLPEALVDWLRVCKGEGICAGGVFGARTDDEFLDMATYLAMFPQWQESGWLPVAGDGCGNYYVLVTSGEFTGQVGFIDTITDPDSIAHVAGQSLWMFLRSLLLRNG